MAYQEMNQRIPSAEFEKEQSMYEEGYRKYQDVNEKYNNNVSIYALGYAEFVRNRNFFN